MTLFRTLWSKFRARFPLKLYRISRFFFFAIAVTQAILLSKYVVDHEKNSNFYGLAAMFALPLLYWIRTLYRNELKYRLSVVWFLYTLVLVIMIGVIFGWMVVEDNKLKEHEMATCLCNASTNDSDDNGISKSAINPLESHSFFDSKFLKITLCFTPGEMLLLLTSVTDETELLKQLYLTTVLDLFDGIEMLEVLHEDVCDKIPMGWEITVLVASCLFFFFSFLEIYQVKFKKENDVYGSQKKAQKKKGKEPKAEPKAEPIRKKTAIANAALQILFNLTFLFIRSVLWFCYDFNSAIFLAKNVISLAIALVDILEVCSIITTECEKKPPEQPREMGKSNLAM